MIDYRVEYTQAALTGIIMAMGKSILDGNQEDERIVKRACDIADAMVLEAQARLDQRNQR